MALALVASHKPSTSLMVSLPAHLSQQKAGEMAAVPILVLSWVGISQRDCKHADSSLKRSRSARLAK